MEDKPTYTVDEILTADDARMVEIIEEMEQSILDHAAVMARPGVEFTPEQEAMIDALTAMGAASHDTEGLRVPADIGLKTPRLSFVFPHISQGCDGNTHVFPADSGRCLCGRFAET